MRRRFDVVGHDIETEVVTLGLYKMLKATRADTNHDDLANAFGRQSECPGGGAIA